MNTSHFRILIYVSIITLWVFTNPADGRSLKIKDVPGLKPVIYAAIQGDAKKALSNFEEINLDSLSPTEQNVALGLRARFGSAFSENADGTLVSEIQNNFRAYWHKGLLGELGKEDGFKWLFVRLKKIASNHGYLAKDFSEDEFKRLSEFLKDELLKQGFHSHIGGVAPFLNLMIWKKQTDRVFTVDLGDQIQRVKIRILDEFVELGWGAYATLGIMHVGGWATKERLFCVKPGYDFESEHFRVSYLAHEARHFADYGKFPKLSQVDLEYRAKLTEVYLAEETLAEVLDKFVNEQMNDATKPHPYASYLLTKDLGARLGVSINSRTLGELDAAEIKVHAKALLEKHSAEYLQRQSN